MSTVRKKYQEFPGKNDFCCGGRLIISKSRGVFYVTLGLIVVVSAFFFGLDCPYLATEFSPLFPIVGGILFLFVLSNLLRTAFIDPGIVPRAKPNEAEFIQRQLDENQAAAGQPINRPPRTKEICINGQVVRVKYCYTCKIFRPPRASHCGVCDNCVERFDHHCPWVGNCVGRRNYRYFYLFVLSLSVYCLFIMGSSITHIVQRGLKSGFLETIKQSPTSVAVILIAFFSVWSVVGLAGFHTFLILKEQTTNEDIKGTFSHVSSQPVAGQRVPPDFNPYSKTGCCENWSYVLCGPSTPSLIDARGDVVVPPYTNVQLLSVPTIADSASSPSVTVVGAGSSNLESTTTTSMMLAEQQAEQRHFTAVNPNMMYSDGSSTVGFTYSSLSQQQQQKPAGGPHPVTNAQGMRFDLNNSSSNNQNSEALHDTTVSTLCSSPNSPSKVRPILLPAVSTVVSYPARQPQQRGHSIAYSQFGQNGDVSPECSINFQQSQQPNSAGNHLSKRPVHLV